MHHARIRVLTLSFSRLKDDHGVVVGHKDSTHPAGQPRIDWTIKAAADWWVSVPLRGYNGTTAGEAAELIDGVLADGAGFESIPNISAARLQTLNNAKRGMLQQLQAQFDAAGRGGVVFANGLSECVTLLIDLSSALFVCSLGVGVGNNSRTLLGCANPCSTISILSARQRAAALC